MGGGGDIPPPDTVADRLRAARSAAFVGRGEEIAAFRGALSTPEPPFAVLHLHGHGGVGKSAIVRQLADEARAAGRTAVIIDGRTVSASPEGLLDAISAALGAGDGDDAIATLQTLGGPIVCLDTYEALGALDTWVREQLVPRLPAGAIVVLAGREPPSNAWQEDPAWRQLLRSRAVGDLPAADARELLARRSVPTELAERAIGFAGGHPLALVLVAELAGQEDAAGLDPGDDPDVVAALVERFVEHVPSPAHRDALAVLAVARVTSEDLLRETVDELPVGTLFSWLGGLSFVQRSPEGLVPHDLAREALAADRRWRDRDGYAALERRIARVLGRRVEQATGRARDRAMLDVIFLHSRHPALGRFFSADTRGWADRVQPADHDEIVRLVEQHEGPESAALASGWLERCPEAFTAFRSGAGTELVGFVANLILDARAENFDPDPGMLAIWRWAERAGPLRAGDRLQVTRFWLGRDGQTPDIHDLVAATTGLFWLTEPNLAASFVVARDIERWQPMFAWFDFHREPDAEFDVGGHRFGIVAHDWRAVPRGPWGQVVSRRTADRATRAEEVVASGPGAGRPLPDRKRFAAMVRDALRNYRRPDVLAGGELAQLRLAAGGPDPGSAVRAAIDSAVAALGDHPRDDKLRRALEATYIRPAPTQEAAAELLDLPVSTYRRHLSAGVARITDHLWDIELSA